jgi:hypothetical protein
MNIGAVTVKAVFLRGGERIAKVIPHRVQPLQALKELLATAPFSSAVFFGVSGHLGHLSEVAAIQRALREVDGNFDAAVSLGGNRSWSIFSALAQLRSGAEARRALPRAVSQDGIAGGRTQQGSRSV